MATQRYPVSSSMIAAVSYDADAKLMTIEFTSGNSVDYEDVPQDEVLALVNAPSVGKYFHSQIKDAYSTR